MNIAAVVRVTMSLLQIPVQPFKVRRLFFHFPAVVRAGWSDKTEENVWTKHGVAGQNAIRGEDAEHNWVWHVLMAFHLDKSGRTAGPQGEERGGGGGGWKSDWMLLHNKSLCSSVAAGWQVCECEVSAKRSLIAPHTETREPVAVYRRSCISVSAQKYGICLKATRRCGDRGGKTFGWMEVGFNGIICPGWNPESKIIAVCKSFFFSQGSRKASKQAFREGKWVLARKGVRH